MTRSQGYAAYRRDIQRVNAYNLRVLGQAGTRGGSLKAAGPVPRAASQRAISVQRSSARGAGVGAVTGLAAGLVGSVALAGATGRANPAVSFAIGYGTTLAGAAIGARIGTNKGVKREYQHGAKNGSRVSRGKRSGRGRRGVITLRDSNGKFAGSKSV